MKKKIVFIFMFLIIIFSPKIYALNNLDRIDYEVYKNLEEEYCNLIVLDKDDVYDLVESTNGNNLYDVTYRFKYEFILDNNEILVYYLYINFWQYELISMEICLDDDSYIIYDNNGNNDYFCEWNLDLFDYYKEQRYCKLNNISFVVLSGE
ncbi:MAG: hypothetical protein K6E20_02585, partial [Acholeplasmatales bacterium]|nr:hypothetical protein [Acholeplasmatales bacterium]